MCTFEKKTSRGWMISFEDDEDDDDDDDDGAWLSGVDVWGVGVCRLNIEKKSGKRKKSPGKFSFNKIWEICCWYYGCVESHVSVEVGSLPVESWGDLGVLRCPGIERCSQFLFFFFPSSLKILVNDQGLIVNPSKFALQGDVARDCKVMAKCQNSRRKWRKQGNKEIRRGWKRSHKHSRPDDTRPDRGSTKAEGYASCKK